MKKEATKGLPKLVDADIVTTSRSRVTNRKSNRKFVTVAIALGITAAATMTSCRKADSKNYCNDSDTTTYSDGTWDSYDVASTADQNTCDSDDRRTII